MLSTGELKKLEVQHRDAREEARAAQRIADELLVRITAHHAEVRQVKEEKKHGK